MKKIVWPALIAATFLAACATAQTGSSGKGGKCDHLFDVPSKLNDQISQLKQTSCKVMWDNAGHPIDVYAAGGKQEASFTDIAEAMSEGLDVGFAPRLFLMIGRFRDNVSVQDLDYSMLKEGGGNLEAKDLNRTVTAMLRVGSAVGHVLSVRETKTDVVYACVVVTAQGGRNAPTRMLVCRSVTKTLADEKKMTDALIAKAQKIAVEDFPSIIP